MAYLIGKTSKKGLKVKISNLTNQSLGMCWFWHMQFDIGFFG
jgi:hypothetical protein